MLLSSSSNYFTWEYKRWMCAPFVTQLFPTTSQPCQCHVRYCLVNSAGDLEIRTCKSSSLLGIGNITWYSQQIHNVKSRGVNFSYLGDHAIEPLHSDKISRAIGVKAVESFLKEKYGATSCWNSASGSMSSSCAINNFWNYVLVLKHSHVDSAEIVYKLFCSLSLQTLSSNWTIALC